MAVIPGQLIFARSSGGRLQVGAAALVAMRQHIQEGEEAPEAGGVLLGRHLLGCDDIIVDRITLPLPGDRQSRHRCFRARKQHQETIDRAWRESDGTCTYLGEWHTHPEGDPVPSQRDWRDWQRKLRVDRYSEPIFFVIVVTTEIRAWEGRRADSIVRLEKARIVLP